MLGIYSDSDSYIYSQVVVECTGVIRVTTKGMIKMNTKNKTLYYAELTTGKEIPVWSDNEDSVLEDLHAQYPSTQHKFICNIWL